jgi:hypothetical protein
MKPGLISTEFGLAGAWLAALVAGSLPLDALWPSALVVSVYTLSRSLIKLILES